MSAKAVFLDRDGTLIYNRHYLADPDGVELMPHAKAILAKLLQDGYLLFLFTNQSGVGRGYFSLEDVRRCNSRMIELLELADRGFTDICIAPEAPDMPVVYRKPSPRFILEMIERHELDPSMTWMVGDSPNDVQAGHNAGVRSVLLTADGSPEKSPRTWVCRDLGEFYQRLQRFDRLGEERV